MIKPEQLDALRDVAERSIEERTRFLAAMDWTPKEQESIEEISEWLWEYPDLAAEYIYWLENWFGDGYRVTQGTIFKEEAERMELDSPEAELEREKNR